MYDEDTELRCSTCADFSEAIYRASQLVEAYSLGEHLVAVTILNPDKVKVKHWNRQSKMWVQTV